MNTPDFQGLLGNYRGNIITGAKTPSVSADELRLKVEAWVSWLVQNHASGQAVGLLADNSSDWLALDLACGVLGIGLVPMPAFFTNEQLQYASNEAGVSTLITDNSQRGNCLGFRQVAPALDQILVILQRVNTVRQAPANIHKVTFTSGTTGNPKGVCLSQSMQLEVARALHEVTAQLDIRRHLCLLPLSVLLENIAGLYAPMAAGADIVCLPLAETGLTGAASFDANQCLNTIAQHQAESVVLLPQMLMALLQASFPGDPRTKSLKFIAVGGGKVPLGLLTMARLFNWPVYEGYGLSECASVVCLNTPTHNKQGTVGKPLPGVEIRIDESHEILVRGRKASPYLHDLHESEPSAELSSHWFPTGDLGSMDQEGYLTINGRKKNLIITGFGRNVSPEWPEGLLLSSGLFLQAVVYGEGQESLSALLVLRDASQADRVADALALVNRQLPDYARITRHLPINRAFSFQNGLCTANGRIRRDAIWQAYGPQLNGETA